MDHLYYLELCSDPTRFDSVSSLTNVFFDDSNKQVGMAPNSINININQMYLLCLKQNEK